MSHQKKLEQVLEYIINEESEAASNLLHQIMVEKARDIYEELVTEDEYEDDDTAGEDFGSSEDAGEEEGADDEFGGDPKDEFASDIESGADEGADDEFGSEDEFSGEDERSTDERLSDIEELLQSFLADLGNMAEVETEEHGFDVTGDDAGELEQDQLGGDEFGDDQFGDDEFSDIDDNSDEIETESMFHESFDEKEVSVDMKGEGKYSGTGAKTPKAAVNTKSMYSTAPNKVLPDNGAKPVKTNNGGSGKQVDKSAKNEKATTAGVEKSQKADMSGEGKYSGTGAKTPKSAVNPTAPLTKPRV